MPETPADVALNYVQRELAGIRTELSELAAEMRAHVAAHGPRVAVAEHRLDQIEADLTAMQAARDRDRSQRWALWIAVLAALLGWIPSLAQTIGS
ncbi:hypothetical protein ABT324_00450 [Saccharopolyspora sp. NPDC000359]|uniref:hypothetical protein n=1 Tax=Saccharopolyspora sp. NPDC000359 TaxID=3154251 RepID=UPI00332E2BF5